MNRVEAGLGKHFARHCPVRSRSKSSNHFTGEYSPSDRLPYFRFVGRTGFFAVIAAFVLIFLASSGTSFADAVGDEDIADNIWVSELAPVVDYGIFNERFI